MSDIPETSEDRRHNELVDALRKHADTPIIGTRSVALAEDAPSASDDEDCFVCDLIEQRLGRRSADCSPVVPAAPLDTPSLARSLLPGPPEDPFFAPRLATSAYAGEPGETRADRVSQPDHETPQNLDETWQSTFEELAAALEQAKSRLREESPEPAPTLSPLADPFVLAGTVQPLVILPHPRTPDGAPSRSSRPMGRLSEGARRTGRRLAAPNTVLLTGLGLLVASLGVIPFAPALFGGMMENWPATTLASGPDLRATGNAVATARPAPPRAQLTVTRVHRAKPGSTLELGISTGAIDRSPPGTRSGAYSIIRDFPTGTTFSHGQALGPNLWTVPWDNLGQVRMHMPSASPDVSLMTLEAFDADSALLAQAAFVVVAERAPMSGVPVVEPARDIRPAREFEQSGPQTLVKVEGNVPLMASARHPDLARAQSLSWSRVDPRPNLVQVMIARHTKTEAPAPTATAFDLGSEPRGRLELSAAPAVDPTSLPSLTGNLVGSNGKLRVPSRKEAAQNPPDMVARAQQARERAALEMNRREDEQDRERRDEAKQRELREAAKEREHAAEQKQKVLVKRPTKIAEAPSSTQTPKKDESDKAAKRGPESHLNGPLRLKPSNPPAALPVSPPPPAGAPAATWRGKDVLETAKGI